MDPINRRHVVDLVKRLGREGKTVLVSSHILHEVEAMTRRVLLIHNGRILAEGDVREIRDLMDEHPHTVALRARDPRVLARAVVGSPHVLSLTFGAEGQWVTVQTAAARRSTGRCTRRRWKRGSPRCSRRTDTSSRCSSTWWRDEGHRAAAAFLGRRPRRLHAVPRRDGLEPAQPDDGAAARPSAPFALVFRSCSWHESRSASRLISHGIVIAFYYVSSFPLAALSTRPPSSRTRSRARPSPTC